MSSTGAPTKWVGSSARKHEAILAAASAVFRRRGYLGANLDEVAQLAEVSKRTVYKHFTDKDTLFTEVMLALMRPRQQQVRMALDDPASGDVAADLRAVARALIKGVVSPEAVQLRRIVIAESERFPEIAATFLAEGPELNVRVLAERFAELTARGELHCADPVLAARHFNWLVLADPLNTAMFTGVVAESEAELEHLADEAVRVFLAAYR